MAWDMKDVVGPKQPSTSEAVHRSSLVALTMLQRLLAAFIKPSAMFSTNTFLHMSNANSTVFVRKVLCCGWMLDYPLPR